MIPVQTFQFSNIERIQYQASSQKQNNQQPGGTIFSNFRTPGWILNLTKRDRTKCSQLRRVLPAWKLIINLFPLPRLPQRRVLSMPFFILFRNLFFNAPMMAKVICINCVLTSFFRRSELWLFDFRQY